MGNADRMAHAAAAGANRSGEVLQPEPLTPRDQALRTRVIEHCAWIATFDRAEAIRAFNWYDQLLPWLELRRKK